MENTNKIYFKIDSSDVEITQVDSNFKLKDDRFSGKLLNYLEIRLNYLNKFLKKTNEGRRRLEDIEFKKKIGANKLPTIKAARVSLIDIKNLPMW